MLIDAIRLFLFPALMAFAASSDLLTMTISNRLSLILAGGFFLLTLVTGMSLTAIGMHLGAAALVLVFAFVFFSRGWVGGGDAKLAAATALWFGFGHLLDYLVYASLLGGALTLLLLQFRRCRCRICSPASPGCCACTSRDGGHPLRHRARGRRAHRLSQHRLDAAGRRLKRAKPRMRRALCAALRAREIARKTILTRFRYRSLTIP